MAAGKSNSLAAHDLWRSDSARSVAAIYYKLRFIHNARVIVIGVVGHDENAIVLAEVSKGRALHLQIIVPALADGGKVGVVVTHFRALGTQQLDNGERWGFTEIVHIFLVSHAQNQNARSIQCFFFAVQRRGNSAHHVIRHVGVDFTGQFDKTGLKVVFLGLPGKVKGIDGNAVPAQSRSRIKGLKAKRFGGGSADDLPDIYAHAQAEHFELVDQRDFHAAIDVLQ